MGLFDRFKKPQTGKSFQKERERENKKREQQKLKKEQDLELKKRRFQAVGSATSETQKEPKTAEKAVKAVKNRPEKTDTGTASQVFIRPLITEKVTELNINNKYVFEVYASANKPEIKKAFKSLYGLDPIDIKVLKIQGKHVRYGRSTGTTKNWKKTIITLKDGDKIDVNN